MGKLGVVVLITRMGRDEHHQDTANSVRLTKQRIGLLGTNFVSSAWELMIGIVIFHIVFFYLYPRAFASE